MKTTESNNSEIRKGAGYAIGFAIIFIIGATIYVISNIFVVSIAASFPIGITLGISLEQNFQKGNSLYISKKTKLMISLLSFGVIIFLSIFLLLKLI